MSSISFAQYNEFSVDCLSCELIILFNGVFKRRGKRLDSVILSYSVNFVLLILDYFFEAEIP